MKVLLAYPSFPDTYWSFRHALWLENKRSAFPPLALVTVAAMLPRSWQRRLVDLNVQPLRDADIAWADVVFVSAMLVQQDSMRKIVKRCKKMGKRVVVGGPFLSTSPDAAPGADHVFIGEAEATLPEFARELEEGCAKRVYQASDKPDMTTSPVPEFDLISRRHYLAMPIQYSRGCPFRCEFCDIIEIYGRVPRTKSNEQMIAELDALKRTGWRGMVFIVDDNFIGNKRNVRKMLPELTEWSKRNGRPFSYTTEASVNLADDDDLLREMQEAGFRRVFLGIETPDERSLQECQKGQNTKRDFLEGIHTIQSYGMEVMAGFIVGFDNDKSDIFDRQIDFIQSAAIPLAMVGILTALPDTQLWRRLEREGRLLHDASGDNCDASLNFIPRMNPDQLVDGYLRILRTVYDPSAYYERSLACLAKLGYGQPEPIGGGVFKILATVARTLFTLGVRDRERGKFWNYLGQLVTKHPTKIPEGVILAAMGYHFRRLTELLPENGAELAATARVASERVSQLTPAAVSA